MMLEDSKQSLTNEKLFSLASRLHSGLAFFEKSLMKRRSKYVCSRKLLTPFALIGGRNFSITSILAWSNLIPFDEILCRSTIPSITMKWYFSQFKIKLVFAISWVQHLSDLGNNQNIFQRQKNHSWRLQCSFQSYMKILKVCTNEKLWVQPYGQWRSQNYYKGWTKKIYNTYLYEFTWEIASK